MSTEIHMKEYRQLTNALTQFSKNSKHEDENNFKNTVNDNWNEAVMPWKAVVSHPSYYPHQGSLVVKFGL